MPDPEEKVVYEWNSVSQFNRRKEMLAQETQALTYQTRPDYLQWAVMNAKQKLHQIISTKRHEINLKDSEKVAAREALSVMLYAEIVAREKAANPEEPGYMTSQLQGLRQREIVERCNSSKTIKGILDRELPDFNRKDLDDFLMNGLCGRMVDRSIALAKKRNTLVNTAKATMEPMDSIFNNNNAHIYKQGIVLTSLNMADKGVAMGSKEYDEVIRNMNAFTKLWSLESALADPKRWIRACKALDGVADAYLKTKKTESGELRTDLSATTQKRVNAVLAVKELAAAYIKDLTQAIPVQGNVLQGKNTNPGFLESGSSVRSVMTRMPTDTLKFLRTKQEMKDIATGLRNADKGVLMGTQAYDDAMKGFEDVIGKWDPKREAEHPERTVKEMRLAAQTIKDYLDTKGDPASLTGTAKRRVDAMLRAGKFLTDKIAQMEQTYEIPREKVQEKPEAIKIMDRARDFIG